MSFGGYGFSRGKRISDDDRMRYDRMLSDRHRYHWGTECPAVDLDFVLSEYNHGITVAIVDYKWHGANLEKTNAKSYDAIASLYNSDGDRLPCFIARYWETTWAFKAYGLNNEACVWLSEMTADIDGGVSMTEHEWVRLLYAMRKDALTPGDQQYLRRLNQTRPPRDEPADQPILSRGA